MPTKLSQLVAIQMSSTTNVDDNFNQISQQLSQLNPSEQQLVLLPECCLFFGGKDQAQLSLAQQDKTPQQLTARLGALAQQYNVFLIAGSIPEINMDIQDTDVNKFANTSVVFSPDGAQLARYQKLHLFDVVVDDNEKTYLESRYTQAGDKVVVVDIAGSKVGLAICYDLRFPELFRALREKGATIITVPAAFTRVTGRAHWQALLQARAIENQLYIIAAGQEGIHENDRETWGHSMIISPWGEILAQKNIGNGIICADYNEEALISIRQSMPIAEHNRFSVNLKPK